MPSEYSLNLQAALRTEAQFQDVAKALQPLAEYFGSSSEQLMVCESSAHDWDICSRTQQLYINSIIDTIDDTGEIDKLIVVVRKSADSLSSLIVGDARFVIQKLLSNEKNTVSETVIVTQESEIRFRSALSRALAILNPYLTSQDIHELGHHITALRNKQ